MADKYSKMWEDMDRKLEEEQEAKYQAILTKANPSIDELWLLPEDHFLEWRRKHDYPKLIASFNEHKPNFVKWKLEFDFSDDDLMSCRFSQFLEQADFVAGPAILYYMEQIFDGKKRKIVAHADLSEKEPMFPEKGESYTLLKTFVSYEDWCHRNNFPFDLFHITSRQASNHPLEKVWLDTGYELLKMGGTKPPINGFGILLRGKHMDFVNLCGLELSGTIYYGSEGNLNLSYSALDHLKCENLNFFPGMWLFNCTLEGVRFQTSVINSWKLWQCRLHGDVLDCKLSNIRIYGGTFDPYVRETKFTNVKATHKNNKHNNFSQTYILLKKAYYDQGDDDLASHYYIQENEYVREFSKRLKYVVKSISYYYWGYGKKPQNVIYFSIVVILLCSLLYLINPEKINPVETPKSLLDMLYFSTVTFTTLGYGDMSPIGWLRIVALFEAFFGALTIGFLVAGFSRSKY